MEGPKNCLLLGEFLLIGIELMTFFLIRNKTQLHLRNKYDGLNYEVKECLSSELWTRITMDPTSPISTFVFPAALNCFFR